MSKKFKAERAPPTTMQRELYSLIGENTPPLLVPPENKFKSTPNWRSKVTPWTRVRFRNGARADGLELEHWVRGVADQADEYRFARFNTKISIPEWSDEDYALFSDEQWPLAETRYLFDLCHQYELRWFVIHDRYEFREAGDALDPKKRSLGDIKERYYDVCRALLKRNPSPADLEEIEKMLYSKEKEQLRKDHLEHLTNRTPAEVAEEEALILESRKLEVMGERFLRERNEIIEFLDSPSATGNIQQYASSQGLAQLHQQLLAEKPRKPKDAMPKVVKSAMVSQILQKRLSAKEEAAYGITYNDKATQGVYLRSTRITAPKQSVAQRSRAVFQELKLPTKPVMPTARVCDKFEALQKQVALLLDIKMVQDRLETELAAKKEAKTEGT